MRLQVCGMRKPVVLLTLAVLLATLMTVLAGCGSAAPTEQPAAVPTSTGPSTTQATSTAPGASETASTPTPAPTSDDALEFIAPPDSSGSSKRQEPVAGDDLAPSQKGVPGAGGPVQGDAYTWEDGDRTLTVYLQDDLVVEQDSDGMPRDTVAADDGGTNVARSAGGQSTSGTLPVFRSESGELLTLPGGVLLVLDSTWSQAQVDSFFSDNGIKLDRVSELSYTANGFFIETESGFPSLDLANELATLDGVDLSSPNWGREAVSK